MIITEGHAKFPDSNFACLKYKGLGLGTFNLGWFEISLIPLSLLCPHCLLFNPGKHSEQFICNVFILF